MKTLMVSPALSFREMIEKLGVTARYEKHAGRAGAWVYMAYLHKGASGRMVSALSLETLKAAVIQEVLAWPG